MRRAAHRRSEAGGAPLAGKPAEAQPGGGTRSLNLIHTNNSPKPASMRVTARFDFAEGVTIPQAQSLIDGWKKRLDFAAGPLADLMMGRAGDAAKSTT